MLGRDFYELLDVSTSATQEQVRAAYLTRLRAVHPGIAVKSDHHKVRDLNIAFTVLSDAEERQKYDLALTGEPCPWCGQQLPSNGIEHHVASHDAVNANDGCIVCGRLPAQEFRYKAVTGLIVWQTTHQVDGNLCGTCSTGVFRAMQAKNLARGPWGAFSLFATPWLLFRNWLAHRKTYSMESPEPSDPVYDEESGRGRPVLGRAAVWVSILALSATVIVAAQVFSMNDGSSPADQVVDLGPPTSTTVESPDGWTVGGCAELDMAARPQPMECNGDQFATVVAVVPSAAECPDNSDWSVPEDEGVVCFEEA